MRHKTWYCTECAKWWTDADVLDCCKSLRCKALVCPDCDTIVTKGKYP